MKRIFALTLALWLSSGTGATAYDCTDVRGWVARYGTSQVLAMAKRFGLSNELIRQARQTCFGRRVAHARSARWHGG